MYKLLECEILKMGSVPLLLTIRLLFTNTEARWDTLAMTATDWKVQSVKLALAFCIESTSECLFPLKLVSLILSSFPGPKGPNAEFTVYQKLGSRYLD